MNVIKVILKIFIIVILAILWFNSISGAIDSIKKSKTKTDYLFSKIWLVVNAVVILGFIISKLF